MKKAIAAAVLLGCVLPAFITGLFFHASAPDDETVPPSVLAQTMPSQASVVQIDVLIDGQVQKMAMEEYLYGVVLGEMPAEFEMEALKAQAVVARTYTCRKMETPKHENFTVCTDPSCCQAYLSEAAYRSDGGTEESVGKIRRAVDETAGQVLMYQGELIEATYFSCSGGRTEDAAAVWGTDVPYLQSVESPGEENADVYHDTVRFHKTEFAEKLSIPHIQIGETAYTAGGGVAYVVIGGTRFSGTQLRKLLGLRSSAFILSVVGEYVIVTTRGFGHRVGMSQYGADAMAVAGSSYRDILLHYYTGVELCDLRNL